MLEQIKLNIKKISNVHRPGAKPDIFIFSTARSGSTFLMELFHSQSGVKVCNEPLNIRQYHKRQALGVTGWEELLPQPHRNERIIRYFKAIREGGHPFLNQSPFRRNYRLLTNRMVFKVLHGAEDMISEIREEFHARIVLLLRHPIAVTISRDVYPRLRVFLKNQQVRGFFTSEQVSYAEEIIRGGDAFETGIVEWCLQNYHPIHNPDRQNWLTLTYEDLVGRPEDCVRFLVKECDLSEPERMLSMIDRPSHSVRQSERTTKEYFRNKAVQEDRFWLITKWKEKVTEQQEDRALQILKKFDIDVYERGAFIAKAQYLIPSRSDRSADEPWL